MTICAILETLTQTVGRDAIQHYTSWPLGDRLRKQQSVHRRGALLCLPMQGGTHVR